MQFTTLTALAIALAAILPGAMYTWGFERQVAAYGVTLADRTLRFFAISLLFHLALGWLEFWMFRSAFDGGSFASGDFAAAWSGSILLVALPVTLGSILGSLYATRNSRDGWSTLRRALPAGREARLLRMALGRAPAPRAWDALFSERPSAYIRIWTTDGAWLAGAFADASYAGGYPHDADILLEEAWPIDADGTLGDQGLGYSVYVPASQIARLEIPPTNDEAKGEG